MILNKVLENSAQKYLHNPALKMRMGFRTKTLSFIEVYNIAKKIAVFLDQNGIRKGDKVLVCAPNSPYWICIYWGCLLKGAIIVPLNIQTTKSVIEKIIEQTEPKILFKYLLFKFEFSSDLRQYNIEYLEDLILDIKLENYKNNEILETDLVQIMYTSGTTGDPKGVMLNHKNLYSNLQSVSEVINVDLRNDKLLSILPLSHIYEQTIGFLLPFSRGVLIVYAHSYAYIRQLMQENKITKLIAVPEFLHLMMSKIESEVQKKKLTSLLNNLRIISLKINFKFISRILFYPLLKSFGKLNAIASGGSSLDPQLEKKWIAFGIDILQGYGLTETSPVLTSNYFGNSKLGSVGKPIPGVEIKIAQDHEILVKGKNVFVGYYKNEEKTKESFTSDGWFKTGDLGEFDSDGFLFIKGRKKYLIKGPGGQNVYPEDIEQELNKIDGVNDSCVLGIEKQSGIEIHAVLLLDLEKKIDAQDVIDSANKNLSSYQQINAFTIWPDLDFPRTPTRKIKKEEVRKFLENKNTSPKILNEKKTRLIEILSHITGVEINQINKKTKIVHDLHVDSLRRVELVAWIAQDLSSNIEETDINQNTTVEQLEEIIQSKKTVHKPYKLRQWTRSKLLLPLKFLFQQIIFLYFKIFINLKVEGKENLRNIPYPVIFMPNHISYIDGALFAMSLPWSIGYKTSFSAARDVLYGDYKIFSTLMEIAFNSFPIQRGEQENIKQGLDNIGQMLDLGYSVVIFPEGRVSESGNLQDLRSGAALVAVEMDSYIIPVKIVGTNNIVPYSKVFLRKTGNVTVKFGKPLKFKRSDPSEHVKKIIYNSIDKL